jgi:8-oxo-dGTP diphosphatase
MPTVIVAAAVVKKNGRILLTRRLADVHLAGSWEFPGGKVEDGEDPEATVVRECREECVIDVEVGPILEVAFHRYERKDVLLLFYECHLPGEQEVRNLGVAEHAWVLPSELRNFSLPPPDERLVRKLEQSEDAAK